MKYPHRACSPQAVLCGSMTAYERPTILLPMATEFAGEVYLLVNLLRDANKVDCLDWALCDGVLLIVILPHMPVTGSLCSEHLVAF